MSYQTQKKLLIFGFLFIPIALLIMFLIYPFFRLIFMSLTDWDGVLPRYNFVGIDNFRDVFTDPTAWLSLRNNLYYVLGGLLQNMLGLLFAVFLARKFRGGNFFKAIIFLPFILNSVAVAYMFNYIFDYEHGPINLMLTHIGLSPIRFLSNIHIVNFSLAGISLWRYLGFTMVVYISALQSVSEEIYESATVDGANAWQSFRFITYPSIIRIVELNLFLTLSGSLNAFSEALVLTKGGPDHASSTFIVYTIDAFFKYNNYGLAAALSVVLLVLILIITAIQRKLVIGDGGYENNATLR
ncbi:sugar ABC transporter permease [Paenibacillus psychroresistens]|uniref:Sugar ABC transporter permease n=2 Tax=Paenibacillus psychroresistens TaxID=1778678 RepID=A0A6B8RI30_9BACL|nr:sugar ABC transporter permease [Paenibacillus psychroresistens]